MFNMRTDIYPYLHRYNSYVLCLKNKVIYKNFCFILVWLQLLDALWLRLASQTCSNHKGAVKHDDIIGDSSKYWGDSKVCRNALGTFPQVYRCGMYLFCFSCFIYIPLKKNITNKILLVWLTNFASAGSVGSVPWRTIRWTYPETND